MALQNIKQIKGATQGSVLFLGPNGVVSENNSQLYWDINNNALGVGSKLGVGPGKLNPVFDLDVYGTSSTTYLQVTDGATAGYVLSSIDSIGNAVWVSPNSLFSGLIGATNGLTEIAPGIVGLGGTISQNTIIDGNGYYISLTNFDYMYFTGSTFDVESSLISLDAGTGSIQLLAYQDVVILSDVGQISLTSNSGQVTTSNLEGLVYTSDYSATFVTYSLITKGYVDSLIGSVGATNGLTEIAPGIVGLGGTISQTTTINGDGNDLLLTNFSYLYFTSSVFDVESDFISLDAGTGSVQILADSDIIISSIDKLIFSGYSGLVNIGNTQGLVYDGDYTSGFVTYSLVTKGYVDSISAGLSASGIVNYIPYWTSTNTLSSTSSIYDDGNSVGIGTVSNPSYKVNVVGDVNITGTLYATSKSFEIEHPLDSTKRLVYGSLEGPEYGVYYRGKLNNEFIISLPDYWTELVDVDTISVNITPIGSHQRLFVEKIENNKVYIGSDNSGSPRCYYVVYAERKDIPKIIVEQ